MSHRKHRNIEEEFQVASATRTGQNIGVLQQAALNRARRFSMRAEFDNAQINNRRGEAANSRLCVTIFYANHTEERCMGWAKNLSGQATFCYLPASRYLSVVLKKNVLFPPYFNV